MPNHLYEGDEVISLVYGRYLATPIPDLFVGKRALQATLLFKGVPHYCSVPWSAITAISDPRGVWFDATSPAPISGADWRPRHQCRDPDNVIDLLSRRTPADRAACQRRLGL